LKLPIIPVGSVESLLLIDFLPIFVILSRNLFCFVGHIKPEALVKALCTYGNEKLTEEQASELVSQMETDTNGLINYVDYVNMMMSN